MPKLKLVCVNIERSAHLDTVTSFVTAQNPDIVCIQELCERDIPHFEEALQMSCIYTLSGHHPDTPDHPDAPVMVGDGIFTKLPIRSSAIDYYAGNEHSARTLPMHEHLHDLALVTVDVEKEGSVFRIATIHFTWTEQGLATDEQLHDLNALFPILEMKGEIVFCGDFNAPRKNATFQRIAAKYKDNIPPQYETSLDPKFHRAPLNEQLDKMVDGIFSTPGYIVSDVELHTGVSDHCAITATIGRA